VVELPRSLVLPGRAVFRAPAPDGTLSNESISFANLCQEVDIRKSEEAVSLFGRKRLPRGTKTNEGRKARGIKAGRVAQLRPIGVIRSRLKERSKAPKQGSEGAPDAWIEMLPFAAQALEGLAVGDEIIVLTWLHRAHREVLKVHPRSDPNRRLTGVFATRSPDRPNPIGLHQATVRKISKKRLRIGPMEAIDGTPVIDIKPVLCEVQKR
jgi:tRNA-Thr(GGU) m(6)t(6)A37 methyltransferase TsaA